MTNQPDPSRSQPDPGRDLRQRAEEKLSRTSAENLASLSPNQTRQLFHELQVHQIELEMQNEELHRVQEALEITRARYFDLYDLAPVGYLTLTEQNIILEANLLAATLLGVPRDILVKQPLSRFVAKEDQDIFYQCHRRLFVTGEPQACELRMIHRTAGHFAFWARVQVATGHDSEAGEKTYRVVLSDISEHKRTEKKLVESEEQFRAVAQSAVDAIISINQQSVITYWNHAAETLFGYRVDEILGQSLTTIMPRQFHLAHQSGVQSIVAASTNDILGKTAEFVGRKKDGSEFPLELSFAEWQTAEAKFFTAIIRDITARKLAETTARFRAEVNDVLASSLDYETTLASVARLAVPHIADWCAVYIAVEDGTIQQLALTHVDPAKVELAHELQRRYLDNPNVPYSVPSVIQTGKPKLVPPLMDEQRTSGHGNTTLETLPDFGWKSLMVVPLIAPGRTLGAITFVSAESGRYYGQADLELAQDLARRAALAMDNARLYHAAQSLNQELDQRVARRTHELENTNQKLGVEVAEHARAREQLRLLAAHLQSAREEERIKIARTIHDELGTLMTAIKMDLAFLDRETNGEGPKKSPATLHEEIGATTELVNNAIETIHQIARELRPGVLDHLGLRAALEWQMQEFQERSKIECRFNSNLDEPNLDQARSTAVFRIMQETLTNVARHAQATRVEASLWKEGNNLILQVRDNGKGISGTPDANRFGILGMRERAHIFGGEVTVQGSPGQGTVVTVQIPV